MRAFFKPMSKDRSTAPSAIESKPAPSHGKLAAALEATEAAKEKDASWNLELHESLGAGSSLRTVSPCTRSNRACPRPTT
jgi:hypothetical protein